MSLRPSFSFYLGFRPRHGGSQTRFQSMVLRRISPFHSTLVEHCLPEIVSSLRDPSSTTRKALRGVL